MESGELTKKIVTALENKKGENVRQLDVMEKTSICDTFVIASGRSSAQVRALADAVMENLEKEEIFKKRIEGYGDGRWIVLDYGDVIVHIFHDETRLFYNLERLWE